MSNAKLSALPGLGNVIPDTDPDATSLLGGVRYFDFIDRDSTKQFSQMLCGRKICAVLVRNSVGAAATPKLFYQFRDDSNSMYCTLTEIDAKTTSSGEINCALVDPWLPSTGCPDGDYCWVIVKGPAIATGAATIGTDISAQGGWAVTDTGGKIDGGGSPATGVCWALEPVEAAHDQDADVWVNVCVPGF